MEVIRAPLRMQQVALKVRQEQNRTIGFVPTMGYLHEGHLSLVRKAKELAQFIVVSIFVNPLQFGPQEDFDRYPRDPIRDLDLLKELRVDVVFMPEEKDLYPKKFQTYVEVTELTQGLCGAHRPGHFRGVTTVVAKLFNLVMPHVAIFGQKDYQQAKVIQRMVKDLHFPIEIILSPIVREEDGLAMSSRNRYLTPEERKKATLLYKLLQEGQSLFQKGETSGDYLCKHLREKAEKEGIKLDYLTLVHPETLKPLKTAKAGAVLAIAGYVGKTRLIDNIILEEGNP